MMVGLLIAGAVFGLMLSFSMSGIETGSYCLNRVRLRVRSEQSDPAARRLAALMDRHDDLIMFTLMCNTLADFLCTACVTALLIHAAVSEGRAELYATAIVTPVLLILGGIVPKDSFRREADRIMYSLAGPLSISVRVTRLLGILAAMRRLTRAIVRRIDPLRLKHASEAPPRALVLRLLHEGAASGGLSPFQRDLIDRVMNVSRVRVGSVMIPRQRAAIVRADLSREDFLRIARMCHFSRLPAYVGDPRRIAGIINVYDVLTDEQARPIAAHLRPALTLAANETVPAALLKLQQGRQAMAIVTDSAGRCVGILTVKDLVEEIVGDLEVW